ncbi:MAG: hypothetical protein IJX25_00325 [Clostridia bacterium]|nr:hypothetical protein [Clostridia bacterium]
MGNLKEIVGIKNDQDFQTLVDTGTLTYGDQTIEYSDDAIYFTPDTEEGEEIDAYTKQETEDLIDDKIADLVNSAPETLDTLGEVAQAIKDNESVVDALNSAIGSKADKDFVNSSISTATATFRGTVDSVEDLPTTEIDLNDYAFVKTTDSLGNTLYQRYKYDGSAWVFEYELNNSSFTASQWETINSGITPALVTQISTNETNINNIGKTRTLIGNYTGGDNTTVTIGSLAGYRFFEVVFTGVNSIILSTGMVSCVNGTYFSCYYPNVGGIRGYKASDTRLTITDIDGTTAFAVFGIK